MSKSQLNEGIVERVITAIFMSIAKKKSAILKDKFENDPQVQFHLNQLETSRQFLEKYLEKRRRTDPDWAETERKMSGIVNR